MKAATAQELMDELKINEQTVKDLMQVIAELWAVVLYCICNVRGGFMQKEEYIDSELLNKFDFYNYILM